MSSILPDCKEKWRLPVNVLVVDVTALPNQEFAALGVAFTGSIKQRCLHVFVQSIRQDTQLQQFADNGHSAAAINIVRPGCCKEHQVLLERVMECIWDNESPFNLLQDSICWGFTHAMEDVICRCWRRYGGRS
jgi:hypothetical protein